MDNTTKAKRIAAVGNTLTALKMVKWSRWYAVDDTSLLALAALVAEEWQSNRTEQPLTREGVAKFLESLRDYVPSLFQNRPPDEKESAKLWIDEVSGAHPPNPFSKASLNLSEQAWLREHEPQLAEYLKETAEGLTYLILKERRDKKAAREKLRKLDYGESEHSDNVFKTSDLSKRSSFRRVFGDAVADFYEWEAKTPVEIPWIGQKNLTLMGQLTKKSPALHELVERSITTAREWAQEQLFESEKQFTEAQANRLSAETLLNVKAKTLLAQSYQMESYNSKKSNA